MGAPRIGVHLSGPGYSLYAPLLVVCDADMYVGRMPLLSVARVGQGKACPFRFLTQVAANQAEKPMK